MEFESKCVADTEKFAYEIASKVTAPCIICLDGDLGAGKTAFTRGFARYFNINSGVCSPTFTIMHQYSGTETINHYDLYRITDYDELCDIGFEEQIESGISLIEWAKPFKEYLPEHITISITKSPTEDDTRYIEVKNL